ncbi:CMRF35-like molecule 9 isoform X2 [Rousettus aegyptiacus]|uniref:CD300 molecule like family member g n=1 Tax=Rousettus aegyptiacus TaxID=9407 RepID=A0A7J8G5J8_ROUAE|nr:CMRF35-like molecule 9 isoform X2 [Rousettus aegyptiacus]KAF6455227.1 CD300 molecule like family member g [Rousettus aegyptiacus]
MRPLVLLWSCLVLPGYGAMVGPNEIVGFEGDTVSLQCTYREELRKNKKYWCRKSGLLIPYCSGTIYTEDGQERTKGRVSIQDNPQELTLNVTLRNLTRQDTGKYWCGVSILGFDETFLVSLVVLQGPPSDEHAGTSLYTGTAPHAGSPPHTITSLKDETSPHEATSPHAGASQPATHLDSASTEDTGLVRSSKSSTSLPMVRILAPVLVLLTLLLATGLAALGRYMLQWRKKVQPVAVSETQRNEKVHFSPLPLKNGHVPEYAVIDLAARTRPHASPKPSCRELQCLSQDMECDSSPGPPLHMSEEEPSLSKFISV